MFAAKLCAVVLAAPALASDLYAIENWYSDVGGGSLPYWRRGSWRVVKVNQPSGELTGHSSWSSYPLIPRKEESYHGMLQGLFQDDTMLVKTTAVSTGGDGFTTCSLNHGCSGKSFDLPLTFANGFPGADYGVEFITNVTKWPVSSHLDVYSADAPSSGGLKHLASLPASGLFLADASFTGDADNAYVLVSSYSNASNSSGAKVLFNTDLWKVPRKGGTPEKKVVSQNTPESDFFPNTETLHMLKVPGGPLLVHAGKGNTYENYTMSVYEVDFDSNKWTVKISGEEVATPTDGGRCSAYDATAHEWHVGCEKIAVIDLNAMKVVRRVAVTHQKPGIQGDSYSLRGTVFIPSFAQDARVELPDVVV